MTLLKYTSVRTVLNNICILKQVLVHKVANARKLLHKNGNKIRNTDAEVQESYT